MPSDRSYHSTRRRAGKAICLLFIIQHSAFIISCAISCTPVNKPPPRQSAAIDENGSLVSSGTSVEKPNLDRVLKSDPCTARLQSISGSMLEYLAVHRGQFPPKLTDLQPLPDQDQPPKYVCPISGQPYVYAPNGLRSPNDARQIIVYDALPGPSGLRSVILMRPSNSRQAAAMWAEPIPEQLFRQFSAPPGS